jgi:subtilase family serine protease
VCVLRCVLKLFVPKYLVIAAVRSVWKYSIAAFSHAYLSSLVQANSESSMKAFNNEAMKLAAMGVTIVVSTGDNGAADDENMCTLDSSSAKFSPYWKVRCLHSYCTLRVFFLAHVVIDHQ